MFLHSLINGPRSFLNGTTTSSPRTRGGLTRLEVAVLIATVAVVLQLLVPRLQLLRSGARRVSCANNLRRIARALDGYQASWSELPPAAYWSTEGMDIKEIYDPELGQEWWPNITSKAPGTYQDTTYSNWVMLILPHLNETQLADLGAFDVVVSHARNQGLRRRQLPRMSCPADQYNRADNLYLRELSDGSRTLYARGNYAINGGSQRDCQIPGSPADPCVDGFHYSFESKDNTFQWWGNGIAGINKGFATETFKSGKAHVVLVEEIRAGLTPSDSRGVWSLGQIGGSITWAHGVNGDANGPNNTAPSADDVVGCLKLIDEIGRDRVIAEGMGCCPHCERNVQATARSMHPGGVNLAMADGTVRFIANEIDIGVWHTIHSREGGDATDEETTAHDSPLPATRTIEDSECPSFTNSLGMEFRRIPVGEFLMGLPDKGYSVELFPEVAPHRVRITRPFYLGVHEVTQSQYERVIGSNPSKHRACNEEQQSMESNSYRRFPVESVSWYDAQKFCDVLTESDSRERPVVRYRLPTEAEWEYACRSGKSAAYEFSHERSPDDLSGDNGGHMREPLPVTQVGSYPANELGLCDMRGNVWEWCQDWFSRDFFSRSPEDDPRGPPQGTFKVMRGSDWTFAGDSCIISRYPTVPWKSSKYVGFRVVLEFIGDSNAPESP